MTNDDAGQFGEPSTLAAWEHVARARLYLQHANRPESKVAWLPRLGLGHFAEQLSAVWLLADQLPLMLAAWHADRALAMEPDHFWAHYCKGVSAYRLRRFLEAEAAFRVCMALQPRQSAGFHNHAMALAQLGDFRHALADAHKAVDLDPRSAAAVLNRALIRIELHDYDAAASDLRLAQECGANAQIVRTHLTRLEKTRPAVRPR